MTRANRFWSRLGWGSGLLLLLLAAVPMGPNAAQESPLRPGPSPTTGPPPPTGLHEKSTRVLLDRAAQARIGAVGRVVNSGSAFHCTGTLVAPDLVLTAAHCVANRATGRRSPAYRFTFFPQWREDRPRPTFGAAQVAVAEGYLDGEGLHTDVALLRLKEKVPARLARPIPVAPHPRLTGRVLTVYSYGYDAPYQLAEDTPCHAFARIGKAAATSCEAVGGISGSPVIITDLQGGRQITAVVTSRLGEDADRGGAGQAVVAPMDAPGLAALVARLAP